MKRRLQCWIVLFSIAALPAACASPALSRSAAPADLTATIAAGQASQTPAATHAAETGSAQAAATAAGGGLLFRDDFSSGDALWRLESGWKTTDDGGNKVLEGSGHQWARCNGGIWSNYALSARLNLIRGKLHINVMYDEETANRYYVGLGTSGMYLYKQTGTQFEELAKATRQIACGWHTAVIQACEGLLNIRLDGELIIVYRDKDCFTAGAVAFETLEDSVFMVDDVEVSGVEADELERQAPPSQNAPAETHAYDKVHSGDLVVNGSETMVIENVTYLQKGNIHINDRAKLVIRNATFVLARGDVPTIHTYFFVAPDATLEIDTSRLETDTSEKMNALMIIRNEGKLTIRNSDTQIHLVEMSAGSQLDMADSIMVNPIGGLLQIAGGATKITNSTIGALGLTIPKNAAAEIKGLKSGAYYEHWDVRDMIPEADYSLTLEKTTILKDELEYGPYERGWLFFPSPNSTVHVSDSELRKLFINVENGDAAFENLKMGLPCSLNYKGIRLDNVIMRGEWPITTMNSNVLIRNSEYLFLQPTGTGILHLVDSNMVEFIPRNYRGTVVFDNYTWTNAGEIIGGESYHSASNDFTITGSLKIAPELRKHLQWKDATVTREFEVMLTDGSGNPASGMTVRIDGNEYSTDETGKAVFRLRFDEANYDEPQKLEAVGGKTSISAMDVDFFTETPIRIAVSQP